MLTDDYHILRHHQIFLLNYNLILQIIFQFILPYTLQQIPKNRQLIFSLEITLYALFFYDFPEVLSNQISNRYFHRCDS